MADLKQIGIDVEVNGALENHRRSFKESENDILRRILLPQSRSVPEVEALTADATPLSKALVEHSLGALRSTGRWAVEFQNQRVPAPNLKTAYKMLLLMLSDAFPKFLEGFSQERSRGRRFVARSPRDLYVSSPQLAGKHAAPLRDEWFFDTNLSTDQVARRVRIAARICGLRYGADLRLLNNLQQI